MASIFATIRRLTVSITRCYLTRQTPASTIRTWLRMNQTPTDNSGIEAISSPAPCARNQDRLDTVPSVARLSVKARLHNQVCDLLWNVWVFAALG